MADDAVDAEEWEALTSEVMGGDGPELAMIREQEVRAVRDEQAREAVAELRGSRRFDVDADSTTADTLSLVRPRACAARRRARSRPCVRARSWR